MKMKNLSIFDVSILESDISTALPYDVIINVTTMYQFIDDNDTKIGGLESSLHYMNENFFIKDNPAINEHHYHITKQ